MNPEEWLPLFTVLPMGRISELCGTHSLWQVPDYVLKVIWNRGRCLAGDLCPSQGVSAILQRHRRLVEAVCLYGGIAMRATNDNEPWEYI